MSGRWVNPTAGSDRRKSQHRQRSQPNLLTDHALLAFIVHSFSILRYSYPLYCKNNVAVIYSYSYSQK